ncbi:hypothetical protein EVAR_102440_1 [Eumeta japonica]|uniref:Uncharacterized protein n=1 Tax=Eumeta variegata TaxID=151549 RepID=A0A4C1YZ26_EUMVA|nr:hypothetical protein EVAR_102440_1 [Eumeta japonica]
MRWTRRGAGAPAARESRRRSYDGARTRVRYCSRRRGAGGAGTADERDRNHLPTQTYSRDFIGQSIYALPTPESAMDVTSARRSRLCGAAAGTGKSDADANRRQSHEALT